MRVLRVFDEHDYEGHWAKFTREAVRAVITAKGRIALVHSMTDGFYKFPGGGVENGESHTEALCREVLEETGLRVIPASIKELGMTQELRKGFNANEIFDQKSYYYYAGVDEILAVQSLDDYEKELGYRLAWVEIETAYNTNLELSNRYAGKFVLREAFMLHYLIERHMV